MSKKTMNHSEYQKAMKKKSEDELRYIIKDANEAIKAMPNGENAGYYQDEIHYAAMELARRKKDNKKLAFDLVKIAKTILSSDNLIDEIIKQKDVANLEERVDEQTYDLLIEIYEKLSEKFKLSSNEREAINRVRQSINGNYSIDMHRNNIFKADHALGIKLPSSSF